VVGMGETHNGLYFRRLWVLRL